MTLPATWLLAQPFGAPPIATPITVTRADRCPDCGKIALGTVEQHDGKVWRTRAACCGAERDELGCRLDGAA